MGDAQSVQDRIASENAKSGNEALVDHSSSSYDDLIPETYSLNDISVWDIDKVKYGDYLGDINVMSAVISGNNRNILFIHYIYRGN